MLSRTTIFLSQRISGPTHIAGCTLEPVFLILVQRKALQFIIMDRSPPARMQTYRHSYLLNRRGRQIRWSTTGDWWVWLSSFCFLRNFLPFQTFLDIVLYWFPTAALLIPVIFKMYKLSSKIFQDVKFQHKPQKLFWSNAALGCVLLHIVAE